METVTTFSSHSHHAIQSLAVFANGELLVSVSDDGTARVFTISASISGFVFAYLR